ncbi:hypothetical protein LX36DRAFT_662197 [Colletotrichum falcatum]|nr:hypothetical protein LX36DRAFT_662197 [Colletotrichum falcatum]
MRLPITNGAVRIRRNHRRVLGAACVLQPARGPNQTHPKAQIHTVCSRSISPAPEELRIQTDDKSSRPWCRSEVSS